MNISCAYGPVTACMASKHSEKPGARSSAPMRSKSNSVASRSAWSATESITSTAMLATTLVPCMARSTSGAATVSVRVMASVLA